VLSVKPKLLYNYFKQLFAQVTNPPIDPIREELVMSLVTFIGPKPNLLGVDEGSPPIRLEAAQPVLMLDELEQLKAIASLTQDQYKAIVLDITYPVTQGKAGMAAAVASITSAAQSAVQSGFNILILSDRNVSADRLAIPALLACSATHEYLVKAGLRTSAGLVIDTGSAREVHHFALLAGYGAEAVCHG
jgi:glutamate synthase (NADPH/NADH) large chain